MNQLETASSGASASGDDPLVEKQALKRKGGPGRKPDVSEPATKRIAQVRLNAKAYRERKQKYVEDLEATVAALSRGNGEAEALRTRVSQLEKENDQLRQMQFGLVDMDPLQSDIFNDLFQQNPSLQQPQQFITPPTLLQFDTFVGTHADLNLENLLEIQNVNLEQLLNAPLPVPPSSEEVIQPHFSGIKSKLKIIPSLAAHPEVSSHVDELIQWYIRYTDFQTRETNPVQCRITLGKIKRSQNEILEYCSDHVDRFLVEKMFDRVKREYSIKTDKEFPDPFEFIRHLRNVSALSNDGDTLDQLCRLYEEFTLHKEQRPVLDAQIRRIQKTLVGKCVKQMDLDEVKFTFDCLEDIFYL